MSTLVCNVAEVSPVQKELSGVQTENHQRLKEREAELKEMKKTVEAMKVRTKNKPFPQTAHVHPSSTSSMSLCVCVYVQRSAARVNEDVELTLSDLQRSLEKLQELVAEVMDSTGQEKVVEAQEVVDKLEDEIAERKRRDMEMKDLVRCEDNIYFLEVGFFHRFGFEVFMSSTVRYGLINI